MNIISLTVGSRFVWMKSTDINPSKPTSGISYSSSIVGQVNPTGLLIFREAHWWTIEGHNFISVLFTGQQILCVLMNISHVHVDMCSSLICH